jgi:hypothetical protein
VGDVNDFRFIVDIDRMTDYWMGYLYIENRAGTPSAASTFTILDINARTL